MTIRNFHERNEWLGTHAERLTVTPEDGAIWTEDDTDTIWQYYAAAWHAVGGGGGADPNAIHVNVASEISAIANKAVPIAADMLVIEDSAALNVKKMVLIGDLPGGGGVDPNAIHVNVAGEIAAIANKAVPIAADKMVIEDSAALDVKKEVDIGDLPFLDTLPDHDHSGAGDGGQLDWDDIWSDAVHDHSSNAEGGTLDWDNIWSDAVHNHSSNAEGGTLDWDTVWSDGVHDHSSAAEGGTLDWDTVWSDAVHDHSSNAEGGIIDASVLSYTPSDVSKWNGGVDPGDVNDAFDQLADRTKALEGSLTMVRQTIFTYAANIVLGGGLLRIYNKLGVAETISQVFLSIGTAPVGADVIVDIHKNGVTIFTNQAHRPTILAGANTGTTVLIDVPAWADGDYLTAIVDQIGVATVGANLTVHVLHS
jgi:hypothetical protein